ncbi:MAG: type II toxin-antitoxin system VapC family toxin [Patescibacteria group bacterium]
MLFDTNVLIAYLKGEYSVVSFLQETRSTLYVSVVTMIEILALSKLSKGEIGIIREFLKNFEIVELDTHVALEAALLCRQFKMKVPDSVIAATALYLHVPLATRDKAFFKIKNLEIVEV